MFIGVISVKFYLITIENSFFVDFFGQFEILGWTQIFSHKMATGSYKTTKTGWKQENSSCLQHVSIHPDFLTSVNTIFFFGLQHIDG